MVFRQLWVVVSIAFLVAVAAGVYFYELRTEAKVIERKMLYLK